MKIRNRYVAAGLFVAGFIVFWILLDYLFCSLIRETEFEFEIWKDVLLPGMIGTILGVTLFVLKDRLRRG